MNSLKLSPELMLPVPLLINWAAAGCQQAKRVSNTDSVSAVRIGSLLRNLTGAFNLAVRDREGQ
jgi:hypothetical protein